MVLNLCNTKKKKRRKNKEGSQLNSLLNVKDDILALLEWGYLKVDHFNI